MTPGNDDQTDPEFDFTMGWYDKQGKLISPIGGYNDDQEKWLQDMAAIGKLLDDRNYKVIKQEHLPNGYWISTVWLGLAQMGSTKGHPIIFETMVFDQRKARRPEGESEFSEKDMERYETEAEAIEGHKSMVEKWIEKE